MTWGFGEELDAMAGTPARAPPLKAGMPQVVQLAATAPQNSLRLLALPTALLRACLQQLNGDAETLLRTLAMLKCTCRVLLRESEAKADELWEPKAEKILELLSLVQGSPTMCERLQTGAADCHDAGPHGFLCEGLQPVEPPMPLVCPFRCRAAINVLTNRAHHFGAAPLFDAILPLFMSPTINDEQRRRLGTLVGNLVLELDDLIRPFVHKMLVVIEPLLIDEDADARLQGREIISNMSKAAGLATMIATMRPDIDNIDCYVRNVTANAFSVVGSALGITAMLPFLKAVCQSKKSWQARYTGFRTVQQIAISVEPIRVLPHLKSLVDMVAHGLMSTWLHTASQTTCITCVGSQP